VPIDVHIGLSLPLASSDASPIVRKELIITLSKLINRFEDQFIEVRQLFHSSTKLYLFLTSFYYLQVAQEIMQQDMMQRKEDERKKIAVKKDRKKDGAPVPISTPASKQGVNQNSSCINGLNITTQKLQSIALLPPTQERMLIDTIVESSAPCGG